MFNLNKYKLSENKVREIIYEELGGALEYYVDTDEVEKIVNKTVDKRKQELENNWRAKQDIREKVILEINDNIGDIVERKLKSMVAEQVKQIENKLLVELARQAMSLDKEA